jgi:predicted nucleic acid-binding protein
MSGGENQYSCIDSNIWLYRFIINPHDPNAQIKQQIAINITSQNNLIISTQIINEVCSNLIRKAKFNNAQIQSLIQELNQGCDIMPISFETLEYAGKLRDRYFLSFWDSLIVASAILGNANILYSEDMQDGLIIENTLQIINPFFKGNS